MEHFEVSLKNQLAEHFKMTKPELKIKQIQGKACGTIIMLGLSRGQIVSLLQIAGTLNLYLDIVANSSCKLEISFMEW